MQMFEQVPACANDAIMRDLEWLHPHHLGVWLDQGSGDGGAVS